MFTVSTVYAEPTYSLSTVQTKFTVPANKCLMHRAIPAAAFSFKG